MPFVNVIKYYIQDVLKLSKILRITIILEVQHELSVEKMGCKKAFGTDFMANNHKKHSVREKDRGCMKVFENIRG